MNKILVYSPKLPDTSVTTNYHSRAMERETKRREEQSAARAGALKEALRKGCMELWRLFHHQGIMDEKSVDCRGRTEGLAR